MRCCSALSGFSSDGASLGDVFSVDWLHGFDTGWSESMELVGPTGDPFGGIGSFEQVTILECGSGCLVCYCVGCMLVR